MAKHSFEFKKKVVLEYLNGKGGTPYLSKKYGLGSNSQLRRWICAYQKFGDEGLMRSRKNNDYSFAFKLHMVELYLSSEVSYQELALSRRFMVYIMGMRQQAIRVCPGRFTSLKSDCFWNMPRVVLLTCHFYFSTYRTP